MTDTPGRKQSRLEYRALWEEIAARTALPVETVRLVLETFVSVVTHALMNEKRVVVRHFGAFVVTRSGSYYGTYNKVRFKQSAELREAAKEAFRGMEKYGVELNNEATLLAKVTGECPSCKSKLESKDPPKCPNCGTSPFEVKK